MTEKKIQLSNKVWRVETLNSVTNLRRYNSNLEVLPVSLNRVRLICALVCFIALIG